MCERITWSQIDAWVRLTKVDPGPWELEIIGDIDDRYIRSQVDGLKDRKPGGGGDDG